MTAQRQGNWLPNLRADTADLAAIESAAAFDIDTLAGFVLAGSQPIVLAGFTVGGAGAGSRAEQLVLDPRGGLLIHPLATASGGLFKAAISAAAETLGPSNPRVRGAWQPSAVNFVSLDLVRTPDSETSATRAFLEPDSDQEYDSDEPTACTLDYVVHLHSDDPASHPSLRAVARVELDGGGLILSVADAREGLWLGAGGAFPDPERAYPFADGRAPLQAKDFSGGEKTIGSFRDALHAAFTRLWELGGGERWYGETADRNVILTGDGARFPSGDYFAWDGANLLWRGLRLVFPNCTGTVNQVADQVAPLPGLTDLADGDALYVDVDYSADHTGPGALSATRAPMRQLGSPARPGSRWVLAWRSGSRVYTRWAWSAPGSILAPATVTSLGVVRLSRAPTDPLSPAVLTDTEKAAPNGVAALDPARQAAAEGLHRITSGKLSVGGSALDTEVEVGSASNATGFPGRVVIQRQVGGSLPGPVPDFGEIAGDSVCRGSAAVIVDQTLAGVVSINLVGRFVHSVSRISDGLYNVVFTGKPQKPGECDVQVTARAGDSLITAARPCTPFVQKLALGGPGADMLKVTVLMYEWQLVAGTLTRIPTDGAFNINWRGL